MLARLSATPTTPLEIRQSEEIERLHEEVAMLRRDLTLDRDISVEAGFQRRWGLTGKEAVILSMLWRKRGATAAKEGLMGALYNGDPDEPDIKIIDVFICKVRAKIGQACIGTTWGRGYHLTREGGAACAAALGAPDPCLPESAVEPFKSSKPYEMHVTLRALRAIAAEEGMPCIRLEDVMGWARNRATSVINNLRIRGFVRSVDARVRYGGRYRKIYCLTPKGHDYLQANEAVHVD